MPVSSSLAPSLHLFVCGNSKRQDQVSDKEGRKIEKDVVEEKQTDGQIKIKDAVF